MVQSDDSEDSDASCAEFAGSKLQIQSDLFSGVEPAKVTIKEAHPVREVTMAPPPPPVPRSPASSQRDVDGTPNIHSRKGEVGGLTISCFVGSSIEKTECEHMFRALLLVLLLL